MSEKDLNQKDEHKITVSDRDVGRLMLIVKERKVFWTVLPIELINLEGKNMRRVIFWSWQGQPLRSKKTFIMVVNGTYLKILKK